LNETSKAIPLYCHEFKKKFTSDELVFGRCPYCDSKINLDQIRLVQIHTDQSEEDVPQFEIGKNKNKDDVLFISGTSDNVQKKSLKPKQVR
jgi:hypothetical protein